MPNTPLAVGVIRTRKIVANSLQIKHTVPLHRSLEKQVQILREKVRRLRHQVQDLEKQIYELRHELHHEVRRINREIHDLQVTVAGIQTQITNGQTVNPSLQAFFASKQGQMVTVTTTAGTVSGTVTIVTPDSVELVATNQDILLIPYSQISAVQ